MATKICKQQTKDHMAVWHIDSTFEKNSTFTTEGSNYYVLVQDGKVVGSTTGSYKSKPIKLNKKFFPDLKCGLFSKNVKVDIFHIASSLHLTPFKTGIAVKYDYLRAPGEEYIMNCELSARVRVDDPVKVYRSLIEDIGGLFYKTDDLMQAFKIFAERELKEVTHALTLPAGRYGVNRFHKITSEEQQIFADIKKRLEDDFKKMGYKLTVEIPE